MKNKKIIISVVFILLVLIAIVAVVLKRFVFIPQAGSKSVTTASVQFVSSTITADGAVTAQNQANLTFQTGGKLIYLPFKAGDSVYAGETIAKLDTYTLQRQLTAALNNYQSTRDTFDQAQENSGDNILNSSLKPTYSTVNGIDNTTAIDEAIARIADQNQNTLNNSVINVELANYALQLSTLTSPLKGIITREDVTTPGVNVTLATTFTVADPSSMVFRANVPTQEIYYISEGSPVTLAVDGIQGKMQGTVVRIYPSKVTLPTGEAVYQVDIASDQLKKVAKLDETGTVLINTNSQNVALVPAWTVLSGKYIWVDNGGTPELKEVTVGKVRGDEMEITGGLTSTDNIIVDPKYIPSLKYQIL
jgi:macrolide-specific efflux system membrane fusion protein